MVEPHKVDECLPKILLVPAPGADTQMFVDRLQREGCLTENLVWRFDTKYYTADVKVMIWGEEEQQQEQEVENVESIIFLIRESANISMTYKEKIKTMMDEYQPEVGIMFQDIQDSGKTIQTSDFDDVLKESFLEYIYEDLSNTSKKEAPKPQGGLPKNDEATGM